jgi:Domain of unknown function (DUF397)
VNDINMPAWRKSSRCGSNTCVEVAKVGDAYLMRDSKNPDDAPLSFTADEWHSFVAGIKDGDFPF